MRILHVFRTPVGGLFRHVRDLARGQSEAGQQVGVLCDSSTGGETAERQLKGISGYCALGINRMPISRKPAAGDFSGIYRTFNEVRRLRPDIIHCHGAKGGLYGRIAARMLGIPSAYTPHGGSLHYDWASASGAAFLATERVLRHVGMGLHFVCRYERDIFATKIGLGKSPHRVIHNGLWPEEIVTVTPVPDASDILFIGDMRLIKGVDVLIEALAILNRTRRTTACLVGDGPDLQRFRSLSESLGLAQLVSFPGRMPASEGLSRGRLLVLPSRAESFPYMVIEACAAKVPVLASDVGGIREALDPPSLFPAENVEALVHRIGQALANPEAEAQAAAGYQKRVSTSFSAHGMVAALLGFYKELGAS
jgi:glycosyltransferase involved in cell wall biosynthesis